MIVATDKPETASLSSGDTGNVMDNVSLMSASSQETGAGIGYTVDKID